MVGNSVTNVVKSRLCHGCGACAYACSESAIELKNFVEIGIRPVVDESKCTDCRDCLAVCSGVDLTRNLPDSPPDVIHTLSKDWGPVLEIWEGHAVDDEIRFKGGSGGAATALALYCIEQEGMYGALHVGMDPISPYLNQTVLSRSRKELTGRTGSRYAPASVCADLASIEGAPAACVIIGKPCDIAAAQKACRIRPELDSKLGLTISIFCGGTPSTKGTLELLEQLGVDPEDVNDLRYRGHGWPGMTGVNLKTSKDGKRVEMTYHQAWDTILTKHKPFRCHICPDGTGQFADIACGDPWYRPIEQGEPGTTLIVVRSPRGREILQRSIETGYVSAVTVDASTLPRSQIGLMHRRQHVFPKLLFLWVMLLPYPKFGGVSMFRSWLQLPWGRKYTSLRRSLSVVLNIRRSGPLQLPSEQQLSQGDVQLRAGEPVDAQG